MIHFTHFQTFSKIRKKSLKRVKSSTLGTKSLKVKALLRSATVTAWKTKYSSL